jgi:hypothetical protein
LTTYPTFLSGYDKFSEKFKLKIDEEFGNKKYDTIEIAKKAVFKNIEYLKEKGKW